MAVKMILYIRDNCPPVDRVIEEAEKRGIEFEYRDISDAETAEDLIERGGKKEVPYLVDVENAVEMYEAEDIIEYLQTQNVPSLDVGEALDARDAEALE